MARVSVMQSSEREAGVRGAIAALGHNPVKNKSVLVKPNFNTADPAPGSTHNDTLAALVDQLWEMGAASISLGGAQLPADPPGNGAKRDRTDHGKTPGKGDRLR
jgi:uncharacterized protein (DUF362 family)